MAWVKVKWIDPMFAALNTVAPNRDKGSDGTIGDLAHASGKSGHNPDDTPGVQAERTDADSKQEVRALDADADLRQPGITMQDVVNAILRHPADRDRLIYIIYRGKIYRKANGWEAETYTGTDKHNEHMHASGDPAADEDGRPWQSILNLGADMADTTPADTNAWTGLRRLESIHKNLPELVDDATTTPEANGLHVKLEEIKAAALAGGWSQAERDALAEDIATRVLAVLATKIGDVVVEAMIDPRVLEAYEAAAFRGAQRAERE